MKWFLIVMIISNNAENVQQIGPFHTEAAWDEAKAHVNSYNSTTSRFPDFSAECFYNGYGQDQEIMWGRK